MNSIVTLETVLFAVLIVFLFSLSALGIAVGQWFKQDRKNKEHMKETEEYKIAVIEIEKAVYSAVISIKATYVDKQKEENSWDDSAKELAFSKARATVKAMVNPESIKIVKKNVQNFDTFLETRIETAVAEIR